MNKFYLFSQNNSGGSFDITDDLDERVFIEAHSAKLANLIAGSKGVYFDGCENDLDCGCCGDRWTPCDERSAQEKPMINGVDLENVNLIPHNNWVVHCLDGTKNRFREYAA